MHFSRKFSLFALFQRRCDNSATFLSSSLSLRKNLMSMCSLSYPRGTTQQYVTVARRVCPLNSIVVTESLPVTLGIATNSQSLEGEYRLIVQQSTVQLSDEEVITLISFIVIEGLSNVSISVLILQAVVTNTIVNSRISKFAFIVSS